MNETTSEPIEAATAAPGMPEPAKTKANPRATKPPVAATVAKATRKATPAKKAPKTAAKAAPKANAAKPAKAAGGKGLREGSKGEKVITLLQRPSGATLKEMMKATGWQAHSVRGFLSAGIGKRLNLKVHSVKEKGGDRSYSIKN